MSGIATMTGMFVKELQGTSAVLLDTRKTAPGQRVLDKIAFRLGGGQNHRMGLYDLALIKDNHIDHVGSITEAVKRVRENSPAIPIVVEARNLDDVKELLPLKVDRIMLDNFSIEDMIDAVLLVNHRAPLEASGGITLNTIRKVALTGVDYISVGEVTHSVKAFDISMTIGRTDD
jgi:nicotinate-nucleotide pyrophosphorylase (carboxylating)